MALLLRQASNKMPWYNFVHCCICQIVGSWLVQQMGGCYLFLNRKLDQQRHMFSYLIPNGLIQRLGCLAWILVALAPGMAVADQPKGEPISKTDKEIRPILQQYCFDCHGDGAAEGGVALDELLEMKDEHLAKETWHRVLRQLRADLMPPIDEDQPSDAQVKAMESWIISDGLSLDPKKPDPGKVTLRRLNRVEYRNTIRDLIGVEFDTSNKFPADDTGHGFDNIADVLTISPLLLEKYFDAAQEIVSSVVPTQSRIVKETEIRGSKFEVDGKSNSANVNRRGHLEISYYEPATANAAVEVDVDGEYRLNLNLVATESYVDNVFDLNECELTFFLDGEPLLNQAFARQGGKDYLFDFDRRLDKGNHSLEIRVKPTSQTEQTRRLRIILESVDLIGPMAKEYHVKPEGYDRFFPRDVPVDPLEKRIYAEELLGEFAARAYRRPLTEQAIERLADLAESTYRREAETFESGIAKSMTAVLASPRFIFREDFSQLDDSSDFPLIDEHSLASRLSYFLWSSMPDEELMQAADHGTLREQLDAQVVRMINDDKFNHFIKNFTGQWLQARSVEEVPINARSVLQREDPPDPERTKARARFFELFRMGEDRTEEEEKEFKQAGEAFRRNRRKPRVELTGGIRRAMRRETEMSFEHVMRNDRSMLELIDSDYTFLNEPLAKFYQIEDVAGDEMRRVELPTDSVRGGILTQGTVLTVTSNPGRTSPVKRGLFVLENLLGTPTGAPPPDIPALQETDENDPKLLTLRETLEIHRQDPQCSSCHNRMDPLGLALENFNAMGIYRDQELGKPIDAKGVLITGEPFNSVSELKKILATSRKTDFYRCLSEKMLTYALGRSVEYSDIPAVDIIVDSLESGEGRASLLVIGIINSNAFQRTAKSR